MPEDPKPCSCIGVLATLDAIYKIAMILAIFFAFAKADIENIGERPPLGELSYTVNNEYYDCIGSKTNYDTSIFNMEMVYTA